MKGKINVKRYFQVLGICLAVLLVGMLAALGFGFWDVDESELDPHEIATVEISDGKINILLMGVDEGGLRTDCIMIGSYDTEAKTAKLLSIPRDTRMYIGSRYQKINAAHAITASTGSPIGAQGTVEAVSRLTGIPINYYVELPFTAVEECIDLLGPVTFEIPDLYGDGVGMVYDDPVQDLHINLKPGLQELNGEQVVHLLRYRKGNLIKGIRRTYAQGDLERIEIQQEFLQALIDQKLNATLILKIPSMFKQLSDSIKTNLTVSDVLKYSKHLTGFSAENLETFSLPGNSQTIDGGSYFVCDLEETRELIETEFGYDASNITIDKKPGTASSLGSGSQSGASASKTTAKATQKATSSSASKSEDEDDGEKSTVSQKTEKPKSTNNSTETPSKTSTPTKAPTKSPAKDDVEESESEKTPVSTKKPASTKTPTKE